MPTTDPTTVKGDPSLVPPEEQSAGIGDNSGAEQKNFDSALRKMIALNAERAALNARVTKARKQMKADGIVLGALDATIRLLDWSPAEQREHFGVGYRYARYAGLAVGEQIDLLAHASDEEVAKKDWIARGRADALRLKPASPPKTCPPENRNDYLEGHADAKWWSDDEKAERAA